MDNQAPNANAFMTQIVPVICNINIDSDTFEFRWFVFQLQIANFKMQPKIVVSLETSTYPPCPPTKFDLSRTCWVKFVNFHLVLPSSSDGQYVLFPRHLAWQEIFPLGFLILHSFLPVKQPVDFGQFHKVKDKHRTHGRESRHGILSFFLNVPVRLKLLNSSSNQFVIFLWCQCHKNRWWWLILVLLFSLCHFQFPHDHDDDDEETENDNKLIACHNHIYKL